MTKQLSEWVFPVDAADSEETFTFPEEGVDAEEEEDDFARGEGPSPSVQRRESAGGCGGHEGSVAAAASVSVPLGELLRSRKMMSPRWAIPNLAPAGKVSTLFSVPGSAS